MKAVMRRAIERFCLGSITDANRVTAGQGDCSVILVEKHLIYTSSNCCKNGSERYWSKPRRCVLHSL